MILPLTSTDTGLLFGEVQPAERRQQHQKGARKVLKTAPNLAQPSFPRPRRSQRSRPRHRPTGRHVHLASTSSSRPTSPKLSLQEAAAQNYAPLSIARKNSPLVRAGTPSLRELQRSMTCLLLFLFFASSLPTLVCSLSSSLLLVSLPLFAQRLFCIVLLVASCIISPSSPPPLPHYFRQLPTAQAQVVRGAQWQNLLLGTRRGDLAHHTTTHRRTASAAICTLTLITMLLLHSLC